MDEYIENALKEKEIIQKCVGELAKKDAEAIDYLARDINVTQKFIYAFFIEYHRLLYKKMYGEEP